MATRARTRAPSAEQLTFDPDVIHVSSALTESVLQDNVRAFTNDLQVQFATDPEWVGSRYEWVRALAPARRPPVGWAIISHWAQTVGIPVSGKWSHGRVLAGLKTQLKLSTRWDDGDFVFQLPVSDEASVVLLLGIEPNGLSLWPVTPNILAANASQTTNTTSWVRFPASTPPVWLSAQGSGLRDAAILFTSLASTSVHKGKH